MFGGSSYVIGAPTAASGPLWSMSGNLISLASYIAPQPYAGVAAALAALGFSADVGVAMGVVADYTFALKTEFYNSVGKPLLSYDILDQSLGVHDFAIEGSVRLYSAASADHLYQGLFTLGYDVLLYEDTFSIGAGGPWPVDGVGGGGSGYVGEFDLMYLGQYTVVGAVPLPPSCILLGSGLLGLVGWRRFRKS